MLATAGICLPAVSRAETGTKQKLVYLVIDTSSSMMDDAANREIRSQWKNSKWDNAVYALQTFTSLLNEQDTLVVSGCNDSGDLVRITAESLTQKKLSDYIEKLRKVGQASGGTIFEEVRKLYRKLLQDIGTQTLSSNQEIWFVVITDGVWNQNSVQRYNTEKKDVFAGLQEIGSTPVGGVMPKVLYFTIGQKVDSLQDEILQSSASGIVRIEEIHAPDAARISEAMAALSDQVSGRIRFGSDRYTLSGNTLTVKTEIPMLDMVVLVQSSSKDRDYSDISAQGPSGSLKVTRMADIVSPSGALRAAMRRFSAAEILREGTYTVTLPRVPEKGDEVTILFQPALEMRNTYIHINSQSGIETRMTADEFRDDVYHGEEILTEVHLFESGTGREIRVMDLPGGNAAESVTFSAEGSQPQRLSLQQVNGHTGYLCTVQDGQNLLRTVVTVPYYNDLQLTEEVSFVPRTGERDYWEGVSGVSGQDAEVSQLQMARDGAYVTFRIGRSNKSSLREYADQGRILVTAGDGMTVSAPQDWLFDDANDTVTVPIGKADLPAGAYSVKMALKDKDTAEAVLTVTPSSLRMAFEDGSVWRLTLLDLRGGPVTRNIVLYDGTQKLADLPSGAAAQPQNTGIAYENGKVTLRGDAGLAPGVYTLACEPHFGLPVQSDAVIEVTDGLEGVVLGNAGQGSDAAETSVTQVTLYEEGAELRFPVTYGGMPLSRDEIQSMIDRGLMSARCEPLTVTRLYAGEGGTAVCEVKAESYPNAGEAAVTLVLMDGSGREGASSAGKVTVTASGFSFETEKSVFPYDEYRSGTAAVRISGLSADGRALDPGRYEVSLAGAQHGVWNESRKEFILNGQGDAAQPIWLTVSVYGEDKGTVTVHIEDKMKGLKTYTPEDMRSVLPQLSKSQWELAHDGPVTLSVPIVSTDGVPVSREKAQDILATLKSGNAAMPGLKVTGTEAGEGKILVTLESDGSGHRTLSPGTYTYTMYRDDDLKDVFGFAVFEITPSDVHADVASDVKKWSEFRDKGKAELILTLRDGSRTLDAGKYGMTVTAKENAGRTFAPEARYAQGNALATLNCPEDFAQDAAFTLIPRAAGEELPPVTLGFDRAEYILSAQAEKDSITQADMPGGVHITATLTEDGKTLDPALIKMDAGTLRCERTTEGNTAVFTVSSDDLTVLPGVYTLTLTAEGIEGAGTELTLQVTDAGFSVTADSDHLELDAGDLSERGGEITFSVKDGNGQSIKAQDILLLCETLPEEVPGEQIFLNWDTPSDGVLRCALSSSREVGDFMNEVSADIALRLKNGSTAHTALTVRRVNYMLALRSAQGTLVHTALQETDSTPAAEFALCYVSDEGVPQGAVPAAEIAKMIGSGSFAWDMAYEPSDPSHPGRLIPLNRLSVRLEAAEEDGIVRAVPSGMGNYEGLMGLRRYVLNVLDRWCTPVGRAQITLTLNPGRQNETAAQAMLTVERDGFFREWIVYVALPIYIVLTVLRALFKKKFPWHRVRVAEMQKCTNRPGYVEIADILGKGFFVRKALGFFFWPVTLIPFTLIRLFSRDHTDLWTQKRVTAGGISFVLQATGRTPFRHEELRLIAGRGEWYASGKQTREENGEPCTVYRYRDIDLNEPPPEDSETPVTMDMTEEDDAVFLSYGNTISDPLSMVMLRKL